MLLTFAFALHHPRTIQFDRCRARANHAILVLALQALELNLVAPRGHTSFWPIILFLQVTDLYPRADPDQRRVLYFRWVLEAAGSNKLYHITLIGTQLVNILNIFYSFTTEGIPCQIILVIFHSAILGRWSILLDGLFGHVSLQDALEVIVVSFLIWGYVVVFLFRRAQKAPRAVNYFQSFTDIGTLLKVKQLLVGLVLLRQWLYRLEVVISFCKIAAKREFWLFIPRSDLCFFVLRLRRGHLSCVGKLISKEFINSNRRCWSCDVSLKFIQLCVLLDTLSLKTLS